MCTKSTIYTFISIAAMWKLSYLVSVEVFIPHRLETSLYLSWIKYKESLFTCPGSSTRKVNLTL